MIDLSTRGLPVYDRKGNHLGVFKSNLDAAINGLKTAAHIAGLLIQKHEIGASAAFARMSDKELEDVLIDQCKAIGLSDRSVQELQASMERLPGT
ncbi:hypothetical protein [Bradyrhizobium sp. sBnM-33]|uniref:hypothetical protein n=1 Tax=Bradyrhizobium sp. sBnM-33 TaxID=2831780 RepID=UPI001BCCE5A4|nr:hypothetical protein [Bradyrhizobium sp. sBnM-33]WOH53686.1 hypothetical protein RX328_17335 [Bradyrhizobium sp. sBnM-33]